MCRMFRLLTCSQVGRSSTESATPVPSTASERGRSANEMGPRAGSQAKVSYPIILKVDRDTLIASMWLLGPVHPY